MRDKLRFNNRNSRFQTLITYFAIHIVYMYNYNSKSYDNIVFFFRI